MMRVRDLLVQVYGNDAGTSAFEQLSQTLKNYNVRFSTTRVGGLSQRDVILITYPDQIQQAGRHPLDVLAEFCQSYLPDIVTGIHILPFYPWTSDDGFSVIDYREVDPRYGDWSDIEKIGQGFRLMFDAVINHASVKNAWFQSMLAGDARYRDYFVVPGEADDLSHVVRPRTLPLLSPFETEEGIKEVWTTFSADQVDLNYGTPNVLLEILDVLLFYVARGAEFIRLDAIAYLWKESGTSCINLPQTHHIIQLFRAVLDEVAPHVLLITETNVPHADNISYFGDGTNEAQMVYNFSLPPLVLHAFQTGSAETLSSWAESLELPSDKVTFFNFLASHDGIGLNPLHGILPEEEIEAIVSRVQSHGGLVSFKKDVNGASRPYELNINYFDALNDPNADEPLDTQVARFIAAHAILLSMRGVPALYFHSLVGSRGWRDGAIASGQNRTINRRKLHKDELPESLAESSTPSARVFQRLGQLLKIRRAHAAFHPYSSQQVMQYAPEIFGLLRTSPDGKDKVLCLQNVSAQDVQINSLQVFHDQMRDLISDQIISDNTSFTLEPYQTLWLARLKD
ncbi:MAG: sugar phosphorylase [Chloroflexota bacterium]